MNALLSVLAVSVALSGQAQTELRAVVLPLRLPEQPSADLESAAPGLERAVLDALARHAPFRIMSRQEIVALVGKAAEDQLMGCDAESCMAEVADALGAELVVTSEADTAGGLWNLRASVLDRVKAKALRRAEIKARSLDGLLRGVDQLARQLAGGASIAADDPRLAERLGTTEEQVKELVNRAGKEKDRQLTDIWTDMVIEANGEREWVALLEGGLLFAAGAVVFVTSVVMAPLNTYATARVDALAPPLGNYYGVVDPKNPDGTYNYPFLLVALAWLPAVIMPFVLAGVLTAWAVVALVDWMDLGRIPVSRTGCCRDEARIASTEAVGWGRRAAPALAVFGGVLTLVTPVASIIAAAPVGWLLAAAIVTKQPVPSGPTVAVPREAHVGTTLLLYAVLAPISTAFILTVAAASLLSAVVLISKERAVLTDDAPPPKVSPAADSGHKALDQPLAKQPEAKPAAEPAAPSADTPPAETPPAPTEEAPAPTPAQ